MLWKIREQEPVSQESMAGIAVRLEEKKRGILELFGRPKPKTWSSNELLIKERFKKFPDF